MLKLYHCPETRSMRSLWLLYELQVPFDLVEMPFDLKVLRSASYLAIHPLGRVPCLTDGDFVLYESGAIAEYLCERFRDGNLGRSSGDLERYQWLQWIHYSETVAVHAATLVQQFLFIGEAARSMPLINLETRRLQKCLAVLDRVLSDRKYLLQTGFSAADISIGYSLHLAARFVRMHQTPYVEKYLERLKSRPSFKACVPPNASQPLVWLPDEVENFHR